jgi:hypothetical protein
MSDDHAKISGWFLGPRGENIKYLQTFFDQALSDQVAARQAYSSTDGLSISADVQATSIFQTQIQNLQDRVNATSGVLAKYSVPFWSPRYNAHMLMENSFPAVTGCMYDHR